MQRLPCSSGHLSSGNFRWCIQYFKRSATNFIALLMSAPRIWGLKSSVLTTYRYVRRRTNPNKYICVITPVIVWITVSFVQMPGSASQDDDLHSARMPMTLRWGSWGSLQARVLLNRPGGVGRGRGGEGEGAWQGYERRLQTTHNASWAC